MMTKLDVFNEVADILNIEPFENLNDIFDRHIKTMERCFKNGLTEVISKFDWSFLVVPLSFGSDLGASNGYRHSYEILNTEVIGKIVQADGKRYRFMNGKFYTDGEANGLGLRCDVSPDTNGIPDKFWSLVAYATAYYASSVLAPSVDTKQLIAMDYKNMLQSLIQEEVYSSKLPYGGYNGYSDSI